MSRRSCCLSPRGWLKVTAAVSWFFFASEGSSSARADRSAGTSYHVTRDPSPPLINQRQSSRRGLGWIIGTFLFFHVPTWSVVERIYSKFFVRFFFSISFWYICTISTNGRIRPSFFLLFFINGKMRHNYTLVQKYLVQAVIVLIVPHDGRATNNARTHGEGMAKRTNVPGTLAGVLHII